MNTFIYQATHGNEYENNFVCFPIRTEKNLDELVDYLYEKAILFVDFLKNEDDTFFPFEDKNVRFTEDYEILLSPCIDKRIYRHLTLISDWDGPKI
jgi:hypothetical protein